MLPIVKGLLEGERRSLSRAISIVDNDEPDSKIILRQIFGKTGNAKTVGFTGPGGAGKSSLIRILDAAGYDLILIESVGAGQLEIEISKIVNITAVVFTPYTGDNIQAIKAGLSEIGDLYVINKGDLQGSSTLFNSILDLIGNTGKKPVVLKASAKTGMGIKKLAYSIDELLRAKRMDYKEKEKKMIEAELRDMVLNMIQQKVSYMLTSNKRYYDLIDKLISKRTDPYQAAEQLADDMLR